MCCSTSVNVITLYIPRNVAKRIQTYWLVLSWSRNETEGVSAPSKADNGMRGRFQIVDEKGQAPETLPRVSSIQQFRDETARMTAAACSSHGPIVIAPLPDITEKLQVWYYRLCCCLCQHLFQCQCCMWEGSCVSDIALAKLIKCGCFSRTCTGRSSIRSLKSQQNVDSFWGPSDSGRT